MRYWSRWTVLGLILGLGVMLLVIDVLTDNGPESGADHFERIDAFVQDQMDDSRIPGAAIAIIEDGSVVHARGFGHDGRGNTITAETPFWIGSNTKSITALATMQLVEAGEVDLDVQVQRYLPEFKLTDEDASSRITVRHLLNQTSGLSRTDGLKLVVNSEDESLEETVAGMRDLSLNRPVGERFEYSNLNSVLLGAIIERVSGETWQAYVQAQIFDPLGMERTYTSLEKARANGLTKTFRFFFGFPLETDGEYLPGLAPTGWVYSTASDMARYLNMYLQGGELEGNRVLSEAGIAEMLAPATNERSVLLQSQTFDARYGAGWFVGRFAAAEDARWHQGSLPYFTAWMVLLPETNQAAIVLINAGNQFEIAGANGAWSRIPQGIVNVLRGETPPSGIGTARFFIIFNTAIVAIITAQLWSLIQVARRPREQLQRDIASAVAVGPLAWEIGVAGLILIVFFPGITGGLGWAAAFEFLPDLTIVVLAVCGLWLLTGVARVARLMQSNLGRG